MKQKKFLSDVWSLLKRNVSKGQMVGYALANIVGLSVILIGVLFFLDSRHSNDTGDKYFSSDFITLSKKVQGIGFTPTSFDANEIKEIENQKWVKRVGKFTSSQFAVLGAVNMGGRGLSSYMFCESVPDDFFDKLPRDWEFDPEKRFVPIILSKDYLALYNFGFAVPQGLPQVSEDVIGAVPITLRLTGENQEGEYFDAAIVGFSSRLNTIAVPQSFMDWANHRYGGEEKDECSRLIVEIDRMQSAGMEQWLAERGIEIGGDKADGDKVSDFLSIVSSVVTVNGVVISLLALFILLLSIFLLLQKSREKLRNLMLLGFSPSEVGRYYELMVVISNAVISLLAFGVTMLFRPFWSKSLHAIGLGGAEIWPVICVAVGYFIIVSVINVIVIRRHLLRIWSNR